MSHVIDLKLGTHVTDPKFGGTGTEIAGLDVSYSYQ